MMLRLLLKMLADDVRPTWADTPAAKRRIVPPEPDPPARATRRRLAPRPRT